MPNLTVSCSGTLPVGKEATRVVVGTAAAEDALSEPGQFYSPCLVLTCTRQLGVVAMAKHLCEAPLVVVKPLVVCLVHAANVYHHITVSQHGRFTAAYDAAVCGRLGQSFRHAEFWCCKPACCTYEAPCGSACCWWLHKIAILVRYRKSTRYLVCFGMLQTVVSALGDPQDQPTAPANCSVCFSIQQPRASSQ